MRFATAFVLCAAACVAQEPGKPADTDKTGLQGAWVATSVEALREEVKDSKKVRITVTGDKLFMTGAGEKEESYTFKLDSSKSPKVIDLYQGDKLVSHSIYDIEKDKLRLCVGLAQWKVDGTGKEREFDKAGDRPTAFDSRQGVLFVLQRGEGKPDDGFARVELLGKLEPWTFAYLERDRYAVRIKGKEGEQVFVLDLPDDATRKAAKELSGQTVTVAGDIGQRRQGDGKRNETVITVMVVSVKTLKKAEPLPKK